MSTILVKTIIVIILLAVGLILTGDLLTFKQYIGIGMMIGAGCISFKDDW